MTKKYDSCIACDEPIFYHDPEWNIDYKKTVLTEYFMRKFKHLIDWTIIARTQDLSVSFMKEMIDYLPLHIILRFQEVDMDFIIWLAKTQPENLDWYLIPFDQIDEQFIIEYIDYLDIEVLIQSCGSLLCRSDKIRKFINKYIEEELLNLDISIPHESTKFEKLLYMMV